MSPSGCKFILKKISCTHFGRKYGDVGERLQKFFFALSVVYSIYFAKMIVFFYLLLISTKNIKVSVKS